MNYVKSGQVELLMQLLRACNVAAADSELEFSHHAETIAT